MYHAVNPTALDGVTRKKAGDRVSHLRLKSLDGTWFDLKNLEGKPYMLTFFRFASCPFCNLRMHELAKRYAELGGEFAIVAVFDSTPENLQRHAPRHHAPFHVLADPIRSSFVDFGVGHSLLGVVKGMLLRMPTLLYGMFIKGYWPFTIKGSITSMPADFLVDRSGVIRVAYYGRDEGDHLDFEKVKRFATEFDADGRAKQKHDS